MYIQAYSNNDIAFIKWSYDKKIKDCLGFCVERIDKLTGKSTVLPAWVGFENQKNEKWQAKDTSIWPVQKFNWRDFTAPRGRTYFYKVTPMIGDTDALKPTTDKELILTSNAVSLTPGTGDIKAYFNRGILSTQSVTHQIEGPNHTPSSQSLLTDIQTPGNPLRNQLMGQIKDALTDILDLVKTKGGACYAALYELNDPELIDALVSVGKNLHIVLSNADANGDSAKGNDDDGSSKLSSRERLHKSKVDITDRFVKSGHIGHNKFLVYVDSKGKPQKVLSGSTNWTYTAMCAQTNNAILIDSPELAAYYFDYWQRLRAEGDAQSADFRTKNNKVNKATVDNAKIDQWFSPNTKQQSKPKNPATPLDMQEVFDLMNAAKKSIQFLVFQPGTPSIMTEALKIQQNNPKLFIRGAATDAKAVEQYDTALISNENSNPDTVVAASNIKDQFGYWEKELLKSSNAAHAIIHDKIVVIDAYGDNPIVITGSHNLGYRASYNNDENLLIISGDKELAEAYSVHVMDVYDHYRWRFILQKQKPADAYHGLKTTDAWQDWYFKKGNKTAIGKPSPKATKPTVDEQKVTKKTVSKKASQKTNKKAIKKTTKIKPTKR